MKSEDPQKAPRGPAEVATMFPPDIPLRRDPVESARTTDGLALQAFFVLILAVAAVAAYCWAKRRRLPASHAAGAFELPRSLWQWKRMPLRAPGRTDAPQVVHRCRLGSQQSLCVVEWHGTQHLLSLGEGRACVIASHAAPSQPPTHPSHAGERQASP
jgi:Flagellar biosynthesis protein, FliO